MSNTAGRFSAVCPGGDFVNERWATKKQAQFGVRPFYKRNSHKMNEFKNFNKCVMTRLTSDILFTIDQK